MNQNELDNFPLFTKLPSEIRWGVYGYLELDKSFVNLTRASSLFYAECHNYMRRAMLEKLNDTIELSKEKCSESDLDWAEHKHTRQSLVQHYFHFTDDDYAASLYYDLYKFNFMKIRVVQPFYVETKTFAFRDLVNCISQDSSNDTSIDSSEKIINCAHRFPPAKLYTCNNLISLKFSDCQYYISPDISKLSQLENLTIEIQEKTIVSPNLWDLQKLTSLVINVLVDKNIINNIFRLSALKNLDLRCKSTSDIPISFTQLKNLQSFAYRNFLKKNPTFDFATLPQLSSLKLSSNGIQKIPDSVFELKNLRILKIDKNNISFLQDRFNQLSNLLVLKLSSNKISSLPQSLINMTSLQIIVFHDNTFTEQEYYNYQNYFLKRNAKFSTSGYSLDANKN